MSVLTALDTACPHEFSPTDIIATDDMVLSVCVLCKHIEFRKV